MRIGKKEYIYPQKKFWQYGNIYAKIFCIAGMLSAIIARIIMRW